MANNTKDEVLYNQPSNDMEDNADEDETMTVYACSELASTMDPNIDLPIDVVQDGGVQEELGRQFTGMQLPVTATALVNPYRGDGGWQSKTKEELDHSKMRRWLTNDFDDQSVRRMGAQLIKSHIYTMVTAALFMAEPVVIWIDCNLEKIKLTQAAKRVITGRLWFDGTLKHRAFHGIKLDGHVFGLSPAFQQGDPINIYDEENYEDGLERYGIERKTISLPSLGANEEFQCLEVSLEKIIKKPFSTNLMALLQDEHKSPDTLSLKVLGHLFVASGRQIMPDNTDEQVDWTLYNESRLWEAGKAFRRYQEENQNWPETTEEDMNDPKDRPAKIIKTNGARHEPGNLPTNSRDYPGCP